LYRYNQVGDLGAIYAADSTGGVLCFKPRFDKEAAGRIDFAEDAGVKPFNKLLNRGGAVQVQRSVHLLNPVDP
jgi:hypothetical protein